MWTSTFDLQHGERLPSREYQLDEGLTGYIIRERRPLLFRNAEEEAVFSQEQGIADIGSPAHSWLGMPLLALDQVIGVLAIENYTEDFAYDEHDLTLLQVFSVPLANAIHNVQSFERLQQQAAQELRVRTSTEHILEAADTEAILRVTTAELQQLLGATIAVVRLGTRAELLSAAKAADEME